MPMNVEPEFKGEAIWGFKVGIYKDGVKLTDIGIQVGGGEGSLVQRLWGVSDYLGAQGGPHADIALPPCPSV